MPARGDLRQARRCRLSLEPLEVRQLLSAAPPSAAAPPPSSQPYGPAMAPSPGDPNSGSLNGSGGPSSPGSTDGTGSTTSSQAAQGTGSTATTPPTTSGSTPPSGSASGSSAAAGSTTKTTTTTTTTQKDASQQQSSSTPKPTTTTPAADLSSQDPGEGSQPGALSQTLSMPTSGARPYGIDATTQPANFFGLGPALTEALATRPAAVQGGAEPGVTPLLGASGVSLQGGRGLQSAVGGGESASGRRELSAVRSGHAVRELEFIYLSSNQQGDELGGSYISGWGDGALRLSAYASSNLLPEVSGVAAGALSADLPAIGRCVDQFFADLEGMAEDRAGDCPALQLGLWLAAASAAVAGVELARRRNRPAAAFPLSRCWEFQGFPQG